jgi:Fur family ferric uptake transcriptional regulator
MPNAFEDICGKLKDKEYKLTPQRQIILKAFFEKNRRHLSAEELYSIVKERYPEIGLATVYRTLDLLAELGILQKMDFGDGKARFELNDEDVHHHHHLICLSCGKVQEFQLDLLEPLEESIEQSTGFDIIDHRLKFYGYCSDCKRENS